MRRLSNPAAKWTPDLAARNLYVLLGDEKLPGAAPLNETLAPYWPVLWRVAARSHYFVYRQPVRDSSRRHMVHRAAIPSLEEYFGSKKTEDAKYRLSFARGTGHDFDGLLSFPGPRGPLYPLAPYPMIAEFRAMLAALTPPQHCDGEHFYGYVTERVDDPEFWFSRPCQRDHVRVFDPGVESGAGAVSPGLGDAGGPHVVGRCQPGIWGAVMLKATLRTKSIGTEVTEEEYARLEAPAAASGRNMSERVR